MIDEGYIKFKSYWEKSGPLDHAEIQDLILWRRPLYAAGLIGYYTEIGIGYGNISTRAGLAGQFVISGTQTGQIANPGNEHFALVTAYDIARNAVHSTGATEASSESMTHATIYELDPEIHAVVHVHNAALWETLKGISPCTDEHIAYGTPEMAQEFRRLFRDTDFPVSGIAVMAGHDDGLISTGVTTQQAAERLLSLYKSL
jgi:class II aldolase/adducin N-terminal domain-containing protein